MEVVERVDAKRLRPFFQDRVKNQTSVAKKNATKHILKPTVPQAALKETKILKGKSDREKLKAMLPTVEAVDEGLGIQKKKFLFHLYTDIRRPKCAR